MDREYLNRLLKIALPIILQNFFQASLNMIGSMMIGQMGEKSVAAVGLANQISFLMILLLFGINSGCAIFTAQFWGKGDVVSIRKAQGIGIAMSLVGASFFFIISAFFPEAAMRIYTNDETVIALSSGYLRTVSFSYLVMGVGFTYSSVTRSVGAVQIPLIASMTAITMNVGISYVLIFGMFGMPMMGVNGAAMGVLISRTIECTLLLGLVYWKQLPSAARWRELWSFDFKFFKSVLSRALPVAGNEMFWSLGVTTYNIAYAHISTEAIAAVNMVSPIENMAFVIFMGISDACGILIGNLIGAGEEKKAFSYARRSLTIGVIGAMGVGVLIWLFAGNLLSIYKVSPIVTDYASKILLVSAGTLWIRVSNLTMFVGIFRSGGDTRFSFLVDVLSVWLVGVPMAFAGAFLFQFPVYFVYLGIMTEELVKSVVAIFRFLSKRWINNLTHIGQALPEVEQVTG
ncbi:MAG TPA: MATE family efflux transporter [Anaerolineaceae bacterium]|nr:MATE family efflux transporter [Anaerolineaceae bacterium]HPN49941.1 MATE family efflux transporter [Anaerolineaceae bacterium]